MLAFPLSREGFPFFVAVTVTTLAMLERLVQVVAPQIGLSAPGLFAGLLVAYLAHLIVAQRLVGQLWARADSLPANRLFLAGWAALALLFLWVYPLADSGALGFASDREEAIDIAVRALWRGEYPYACRVQSGVHAGCPRTGNPIAPMPGALLLATPVVFLLGGAGWLSLLSLGVAYQGMAVYWRDAGRSLMFVAFLLATAPILLAEILTGGDHLANTLSVCVPLILLVQDPRRRYAPGLALLLGVALSWRGVFWLLAVPVFAHRLRHGRWRDWLVPGGIALAGFALVTLPLLLWRPEAFTPWQVQQRYDLYAHLLPHAGLIVPALTLALGAFLGWRAETPEALFLACGWVLLLPVLAGAVLHSLDLGRPTLLFYGWYGIFALPLLATPAFHGPQPGRSA